MSVAYAVERPESIAEQLDAAAYQLRRARNAVSKAQPETCEETLRQAKQYMKGVAARASGLPERQDYFGKPMQESLRALRDIPGICLGANSGRSSAMLGTVAEQLQHLRPPP